MSWYQKDKLHNIDGPGRVTYDTLGQVVVADWYTQGKLHPDPTPADK